MFKKWSNLPSAQKVTKIKTKTILLFSAYSHPLQLLYIYYYHKHSLITPIIQRLCFIRRQWQILSWEIFSPMRRRGRGRGRGVAVMVADESCCRLWEAASSLKYFPLSPTRWLSHFIRFFAIAAPTVQPNIAVVHLNGDDHSYRFCV